MVKTVKYLLFFLLLIPVVSALPDYHKYQDSLMVFDNGFVIESNSSIIDKSAVQFFNDSVLAQISIFNVSGDVYDAVSVVNMSLEEKDGKLFLSYVFPKICEDKVISCSNDSVSVCKNGCAYSRIQDALDNTHNGEVCVKAGLYEESLIIDNKINLVAEDFVEIKSQSEVGVVINNKDVKLANFVISSTKYGVVVNGKNAHLVNNIIDKGNIDVGVYVDADNVKLTDNIIRGQYYGVLVDGEQSNTHLFCNDLRYNNQTGVFVVNGNQDLKLKGNLLDKPIMFDSPVDEDDLYVCGDYFCSDSIQSLQQYLIKINVPSGLGHDDLFLYNFGAFAFNFSSLEFRVFSVNDTDLSLLINDTSELPILVQDYEIPTDVLSTPSSVGGGSGFVNNKVGTSSPIQVYGSGNLTNVNKTEFEWKSKYWYLILGLLVVWKWNEIKYWLKRRGVEL